MNRGICPQREHSQMGETQTMRKQPISIKSNTCPVSEASKLLAAQRPPPPASLPVPGLSQTQETRQRMPSGRERRARRRQGEDGLLSLRSLFYFLNFVLYVYPTKPNQTKKAKPR